MLFLLHDKKGGVKLKLAEVAKLRTGLVLNRKIATFKDEINVTYRQLTLKSINENGTINLECLENFVSKENLKREYFTEIGDIIVRLSHPYTAVVIDDRTKDILVPSHFAIIRCDETKINPDYLQWILNCEKTKNKISVSTSRSALGTIRPSFYLDFEIKVIPMESQKAIAKINYLWQNEVKLLDQLKEEKDKYYKAITNKIQKEME